MNQGAFLMRGLEKVRAEFSLTALAYNLRRVLNIVGFSKVDCRATGLTARSAFTDQFGDGVEVTTLNRSSTDRKCPAQKTHSRSRGRSKPTPRKQRFHTICLRYAHKREKRGT